MCTHKKLHILLAEDDEDDAEIFMDIMKDLVLDINVILFNDGALLMYHLENQSTVPDLIFMDLNMPKKNGFECLAEIKSNDKWKSIKTIILTTSSDTTEIKRCYDLGADLFITKSPDYFLFKSIIYKSLKFSN